MHFDRNVFVERPSIWGEVRWPRSLGKALNQGPEHGLDILYRALYWEGIGRDIEMRCLKHDASTATEHVVWFWGPHFAQAGTVFSFVEVRFAAGVPWEPAPKLQPFRVVHPNVAPAAETGGEVGPFEIHAPIIGVRADEALTLRF